MSGVGLDQHEADKTDASQTLDHFVATDCFAYSPRVRTVATAIGTKAIVADV